MVRWCVFCAWWCAALAGGTPEPPRPLAARASFELETAVQLHDAERNDKEIGYRIRAHLDLLPLWADHDTDYLLQFTLRSPKLYLRGKHVNADFMPHASIWDSYSDTTFYAHWSSGLIKQAYLDPTEPLDVLNYKKSLLSLFQFQMLDGEHNETDVSGPCLVLYETLSTQVFRKIKSECAADGGVVSSARRVARYTLSDARDALLALHADELLALAPAALGLKARAWTALRRAPAPAPAAPPARPAPPHAALPDAVRALPAALRPLPLELAPAEPAQPADDEPPSELSEVLEEEREALRGESAGEGGAAEHAAAALRLLPALRRAPAAPLLQLLRRAERERLPALCRLLGLAATAPAFAAARDFLQLNAPDPLDELAHAYLGAFALADAPDERAALDVLRLGEEARAPAVRDAALLAAGAAARRLRAEPAQRVRDELARGLARCRDAACRALRLRALGNMRRADTADLLLEHAARAEPAPALAALHALAALPPRALTFARLDRLAELALDERAALEARAAALDLVVLRRAALPASLARLAYALHARGPHELRRVLWQRVRELADEHEALRALPALLEPELRGWDAQAHAGTSSVLSRAAGWAAGGWRARLRSRQLARAGLLRRGAVWLRAEHAHRDPLDLLTVEVWTRGLEAFGGSSTEPAGAAGAAEDAAGAAGAAEDAAGAAEDAAGGLALSVGGAHLRDITLFDGQAELLGHVWAGAGSTPTPVLRALLPLARAHAAVPLLGGVRLRADAAAALALALDAHAQLSLWYRSARAELRLRAGAAGRVRARLRTAWAELDASADLRAEPRLRIAADLDFYDAVALCVRVRTDDHELRRNVTLESRQGARRLRVRRRRVTSLPAPGRTLALGRPNDGTCRTLLSAEPAEHA